MDQDTYDSMIHKRDDVDYSWEKRVSIVNDIRNFIFGLAGATTGHNLTFANFHGDQNVIDDDGNAVER